MTLWDRPLDISLVGQGSVGDWNSADAYTEICTSAGVWAPCTASGSQAAEPVQCCCSLPCLLVVKLRLHCLKHSELHPLQQQLRHSTHLYFVVTMCSLLKPLCYNFSWKSTPCFKFRLMNKNYPGKNKRQIRPSNNFPLQQISIVTDSGGIFPTLPDGTYH